MAIFKNKKLKLEKKNNGHPMWTEGMQNHIKVSNTKVLKCTL